MELKPTKHIKRLSKITIKFGMELKPTKHIVVNYNYTPSLQLQLLVVPMGDIGVASSYRYSSLIVLNNSLHNSQLRARKDCSINQIHTWSDTEVGYLKFVEQKSSLVKNCPIILTQFTLMNFVSIIPYTPCHYDHELQNFFPQLLLKF